MRRNRSLVRWLTGLAYLAGTGVWTLLMLVSSALKCDDACGAPPYRDWTDNVDAWQYGAIMWLGVAGFCLAVAVVAASWLRPRLAVAALLAHGAVFVVNLVILLDRPSGLQYSGEPRLMIPVLLTASAGVLTVMLAVRSAPPGASRAAFPATS